MKIKKIQFCIRVHNIYKCVNYMLYLRTTMKMHIIRTIQSTIKMIFWCSKDYLSPNQVFTVACLANTWWANSEMFSLARLCLGSCVAILRRFLRQLVSSGKDSWCGIAMLSRFHLRVRCRQYQRFTETFTFLSSLIPFRSQTISGTLPNIALV